MVKKILLALVILVMLCFSAQAAEVEGVFSWEQHITSDFGGWMIFVSNTPDIDTSVPPTFNVLYVGTQDEYTTDQIIIVPDDVVTVRYATILSYDKIGNKSDPHDAITMTFNMAEAPPIPFSFKFTINTGN